MQLQATGGVFGGSVIEITRMATRRAHQGIGIGRLMLADFVAGQTDENLILAAQSKNPAFPALLKNVAANEGKSIYPTCDDPYLGRMDAELRAIAFELAGDDLHIDEFEGARIAYNMARYSINGIRHDQNFKNGSPRTASRNDNILERNPRAASVYVARVAVPEL